MTEFNQAVYEQRIDAMKARERDAEMRVNISRAIQRGHQHARNTDRLAAYKSKRAEYE